MLRIKQFRVTAVYIYIYIYIYMCVCVCVCVCLGSENAKLKQDAHTFNSFAWL